MMKNILTVLTLIFCSFFVFAQDDSCNEFLTNMTKAVETSNIVKAKTDMKAFIVCMENNNLDTKSLNVLNEIKYFVNYYDKNFIIVKLNNDQYALIKNNFNSIIKLPNYNYIDKISEGLARVVKDKKVGFIDNTGNEVIPSKYDSGSNFSEGLAAVQLNGKYGFINKEGEEIIDFKYEFLNDFKQGLSKAELNEKYGFINKFGEAVIPFKYHFAENFKNGFAIVKLWNRYSFIDMTGKEIIPFDYDYISDFSEGYAIARFYKSYTYIDITGKRINYFAYNKVESFKEGKARVEVEFGNGKPFFINLEGKCIDDCENAPTEHPRTNN